MLISYGAIKKLIVKISFLNGSNVYNHVYFAAMLFTIFIPFTGHKLLFVKNIPNSEYHFTESIFFCGTKNMNTSELNNSKIG